MSKPTITIEDIIAYHEEQARVWGLFERIGTGTWADSAQAAAAAHREAAALLRKGLDE